jgi:hypothetical protein
MQAQRRQANVSGSGNVATPPRSPSGGAALMLLYAVSGQQDHGRGQPAISRFSAYQLS